MFAVHVPPVTRKPRLEARATRPLGVLLATLPLVLGLAGPAAAESQTVTGTGAVKKMSVTNGQGAVVGKVFGPGKPCDITMSVSLRLRDRDGTRYLANGACHPGAPEDGGGWHKSLARGNTGVTCSGFKLTYNSTGKFWRFEIPRSCVGRLANQVKANGEMSATTSATLNQAGPTRWLARG